MYDPTYASRHQPAFFEAAAEGLHAMMDETLEEHLGEVEARGYAIEAAGGRPDSGSGGKPRVAASRGSMRGGSRS